MAAFTFREAKKNLSDLLRKAVRGEEVIIVSLTGSQIRLVPIKIKANNRRPGALKGKLHVGPEFFEPLPGPNCPAGNSDIFCRFVVYFFSAAGPATALW